MNGSPRVVLLTTGLGKGGAETQLVRLSLYLIGRGWRVRVISLLRAGEFANELRDAGAEVTSLGGERTRPDPLMVFRLVRLLARDRPDILVTFMYHANVIGRIAGRLARVPAIVGSIRNEKFGGWLRDRMERWTEWLSDATTTNSALAASSLLERGVVARKRLWVIPNGIPTENFAARLHQDREALRRSLGVATDQFLWLAVGSLEDQKDYPTLFEAFGSVSRGIPTSRLRVAGEGSRREPLEALRRSLNLEERVRLIGSRADIPALLQAADGYVLSSAWEGMPNAVMEALAAARPVVATRVGGVAELVEDGVSGLLVPPRDPEALAEAMTRMMQLEPGEREAMGRAGRHHIAREYGVERVMETWEAFLRSLLPAGRSLRPKDEIRARRSTAA